MEYEYRPGAYGPAPKRTKGRQPCTFEGCTEPNRAHGLCGGHAAQKKRGVPLRPIRPARPDDADGMRWCGRCKLFVDEDLFGWDTTRAQPKRTCRPCEAAAMLQYADRTGRDRINLKRRLKKHGLTPEEYAAKLAAQDGKCAICKKERPLDIDHDHETEQRRDLLCGPCNRGIGFMEDDVVILQAAIDYLNRWR